MPGTCTHVHVALIDFIDAVLNEPPLERAAWQNRGRAEYWWGEHEVVVWTPCDGPEVTTGLCCTLSEAHRSVWHAWPDDKPAIFEPDTLWAHEYAEGLGEPFCACGRRISQCDGSRRGCHLPARIR